MLKKIVFKYITEYFENMNWMNFFYAITLELVFLSFCIVLIGLGVSELRKNKPVLPNVLLSLVGFILILLSFYVTHILIEA